MSDSVLFDSTRTTHHGSTCTDFTTESDLTSDITSTSTLQGSLQEYEIHHSIGRGKYSQVFSAIHKPTNTTVAIKRVQIFDMMDSQTRSDCLKEVKILQNVDHPNIVKCYNSFIQDNELIIVLEWAESGDLGNIFKQRAAAQQYFTPQEVWNLFSQVCSAVNHMHNRRMMHRDLKPSNIFVTAGGVVKLGDLGLSRTGIGDTCNRSSIPSFTDMASMPALSPGYFSSRTLQAVTTVGTPYYMSPECIRGQPYDFSSDIWSLGCLLYELIALKNPFYKESQSLYALGKSINSCAYDPLPDTVPAVLRNLVTIMLQPLPQSRPSIGQVLQCLAQASPDQLQGLGVQAPFTPKQ